MIMEQREVWRNVTGTAVVLGLAITSMSFNATQVISTPSEIPSAIYGTPDERSYNAASNLLQMETSNVYIEKKRNHLEEEAEHLFGPMREATAQESASVNNYIRSISKDMGVNFFDLC